MRKWCFVVLAWAVVGAAGCRSTRSIREAITTPAVHPDTAGNAARAALLPARDLHADSMAVIHKALAAIAHNHIDFQTFSGTMRVHYQGNNGEDYKVTAVVKIQKDSFIYIEIYGNIAMSALKVFEAMITRDSVKIYDVRRKVLQLRSVSYLQEEFHLPVNFEALQSILIGNPIYLDTANILYYRTESHGLSLFSVGPAFTNFLTLNTDNTLNHSKLDATDPMSARTCDITYGDYDYKDHMPFSTYRKISLSEKGKVDIEIGINKHYKFNEPLIYKFSLPKNYKRR